jgi:penicillin-binding protein 1A
MTFGVAFCAVVVGVLGAVGWVVNVADSAPNLSELKPTMPHGVTEVFASDGTPLGYVHSDSVHLPMAGWKIPQMMKWATIAIEDRRFYQHGALDYQGILRAGIKDLFGGGSLQGASTLTMQLVDNMYLKRPDGADRNLKYKIKQAKLAEQLEQKHSKNWVLDTYLDVVPYGTDKIGETAYGVAAAAELFFDKPVTDLNIAQMALLAGLPQAPTPYNPFYHPIHARARRHEVLVAMEKARYITHHEAVVADHSPLQVKVNPTYSGTPLEPYVFDYAVKQAEARYGAKEVETGGLKIYTTINLKDQRYAREALFSHESGGPGNVNAALASVDSTNGHILALAGTEQYSQNKFFYPVYAQRQTGSAAKVFALMTLIHDYDGDPNQTYYTSKELTAGWDPAEPTWSVHTDTNTYAGTINVTNATTISDNTVFAQLVVDLGVSKFEAVARSMGLPISQMIGAPAEVLGGWKNGITMLQMAAADSVLASGGLYRPPTILDHVVFPNGHVDNVGNEKATRVFTSGETYAATNVLKTVIQSGTGTAANYGCPVAGKTGTAENLANAWFVGYNPRIATAVWVGYDKNNQSLGPNGFGGVLAAPIWQQFMKSASGGYCADFPQPTTYWSGVPFMGPNATTGNPTVGTGTTSGKSKKTKGNNPYNNTSLYAHPPQGPPTGGTGIGTGTAGKGKGGTGTTGTGGRTGSGNGGGKSGGKSGH